MDFQVSDVHWGSSLWLCWLLEVSLPLAVTTAAAGSVYDADPQVILFLSTTVAWPEVHCNYWVQDCWVVVWGKICYDLLSYFTHKGETYIMLGLCTALHSNAQYAQRRAAFRSVRSFDCAVHNKQQQTKNNT